MNPTMQYRAGYKYQLARDYAIQTLIYPAANIGNEFIQLDTRGVLVIRSSYAWDGCSGPTKDDKTNMVGGLAHDALCQLMREGRLGPEWFDRVNGELVRLCKEDGMGWFRRWYYFRGVEDFGKCAAQKGATPYPILAAPCVILALLLTAGCAGLGLRETSIQMPDGDTYTIRCLYDAKVKFAKGDVSIDVDNQGKPNPFESAMGVAATTAIGAAKAVTPTAAIK